MGALLLSACSTHPKSTLPTVACNPYNGWIPGLRAEAKAAAEEIVEHAETAGAKLDAEQREALFDEATDVVMWRMVRTQLIGGNFNNLGVVLLRGLKTARGRPVVLFRTGLTPDPEAPGSCVRSLLEAGGVRHTVNLYAGDMPVADLIAAEARAVAAAGGSYFDVAEADPEWVEWRDRLRDDPRASGEVAQVVAELINRQILRPGGRPPEGNLHVHCGGGMHRTGMVVGILQRCLNGESDAAVIEEYRSHVAWRSNGEPGGYEQGNVDFILRFDCDLLDTE